MRATYMIGILVVCMTHSAIASNEITFPYTAYVDNSGTTVLSGPGHKYYATDRLEWGTRVEVFSHQGRWAAISPPAESFSWVPVKAVEATDRPQVVRVVAAVRTRVGSKLSDRHNAALVRLRPGDLLEVLGRQPLDESPGTDPLDWYKVVPPAGEYRWVRIHSLSNTPPIRAGKSLVDSGSPANRDHQFARSDSNASMPPDIDWSFLDRPARGGSSQGNLHSLSSSTSEPTTYPPVAQITSLRNMPGSEGASRIDSFDNSGVSADDAMQQVQFSPSAVDSRYRRSTGNSAWREVDRFHDGNSVPFQDEGFTKPTWKSPQDRSLAPTSTQQIFRGTSDTTFLETELVNIELELANVVCADPESWDLIDLRARTQAVIDASQPAKFRERAQNVLAKIARFEDVQRRSLQMSSGLANIDSTTLVAAVTAASANATYGSTQLARNSYDGSGWLMPVVTRKNGLPKYVLADENGSVLQFVTPQPGLKLNSYVRKRVGVYGQKSFLPSFQRPHLVAQRIVTLDTVR